MDDLLRDFISETAESLAELDLALIRLERHPDDNQTLSLIFRLMHTIKGTCGFLGLPRLEKLAHAAETVLDGMRGGTLPVSSGGVGLILSAIDGIRHIVSTLERSGHEPEGADATLITALDSYAAGITGAPAPSSAPAAASVRMDRPPEPAAAELSAAATEVMDQTATSVRGQTIRVSVDVLESLMTVVSELVLTRNQFLQHLRTSEGSDLTGSVQRLSHLTSELQERVMKTRMQPIGNVWNILPRQIRDLAHDLGKRIDLVMRGADTELDRQVLELIKDPLTHMIRNSADHGIELPDVRVAAGKAPGGTIRLSARHEGGHVVIEIEDDGRGIDTARVLEKAIAQGLVTSARAATLSEEEVQRFIFAPGFSTASAVTAVSGRGVGMDVVRTNIEQIGGSIAVHSMLGRGSRFVIKIPLTLAIVSALIVGCAGERFAIPQASVVEVVRPGMQAGIAIENVGAQPVLRLREELLPLVRLATLLEIEAVDVGGERPTDTVAVLTVGGARLGLIVDGIFDTEEIVVKPVNTMLRHIAAFGGNTILEDGSVIMILDPTGIARHARVEAAAASDERAPDAGDEDDSLDMLLLRAGPGAPCALPLSLIARLESIPSDQIELSGETMMVQYRGKLMPLIAIEGVPSIAAGPRAVLVFEEDNRPVGMIVDAILDVVPTSLKIELRPDRPGFLGTAVIAGRATDVVDTSFWLARVASDWFNRKTSQENARNRLLVVDDSRFFRQLVAPTLSAAGYDVTVVESAEAALGMRDRGRSFDAIVSDLEMPGMDGLTLARTLREGGQWSTLPILALTSRDAGRQAREAGFTDIVRKFERDKLLESLSACLSETLAA
ncbi:hybrid sensor histidine kinase/response regulator [Acetobacteraceae bacterium KSS12]|uniref:histidine kinase n=2 Tax=Rhizosaccharibacter radicis TaxID=2782605 RepID=A0ABT1VWH2_9PROT|nr:hybrid sensor histidine kinase/response regulator [Acetobacteraceae bacterium KSS12]